MQIPQPAAQVRKSEGNAQTEQTPAADQGPSRAWHIMRQWNCPPLLLGLSQQLAKTLEPVQRNGPAWQEVKDGGTLRLKLEIEADQPGEVIVGLFKDARWSAPPVAVRRVSAGTQVLAGLPAGQYQIGAMLGNAPLPFALGMQRTWPEPVEIKAGQTADAEVLVSAAFEEQASGWYNEEVAKDYVGDWGRLNESKLLHGQLTDPAGKPIPFGEIMIREYKTDKRSSFAAPNRGTNEQGLYRFDRMAWPYRVMASWRETLPSLFGCRIQTVFLNRVLEGAQRVNFHFEPFPEGTAKLTGRVRDQAGRPVEGFFLRVMTDAGDKYEAKAKAWDQPDEKSYTDTCYEVPFLAQDGSFELGGLPAGAVRVWVIPFEGRRYEHADLKDATLAAGQTANVNFQLTGKDALYGRVLFEDGTPAVLRPAPWRGAGTRIMLSRGGVKRAPTVSEVDTQGYFAIYLDQGERERFATDQIQLSISLPVAQEHRFETVGEFPADKLAQNKSQAGVIRIKRPESAAPALPEKPRAGDEPAATSTPEKTKPADSRAWYILRQWNCPPLLLGLMPQLAKTMEPEHAVLLDTEVTVTPANLGRSLDERISDQARVPQSTRTVEWTGTAMIPDQRHAILLLDSSQPGADHPSEVPCLIVRPTIVETQPPAAKLAGTPS